MDHSPADSDGVDKTLVALDELFHRHRVSLGQAAGLNRCLQFALIFDLERAGGAGAVRGLDDEREAAVGGERARLIRIASAGRLSAGDARFSQRLLHRRLVAAQKSGFRRGARNPAGLAHLRRRHDMGFHRGLDAVHPGNVLDATDRLQQGGLVDHRGHPFVVRQPALDVAVQMLGRPLADAQDVSADRAESAHEFFLVVGKRGLDKNDVHFAADLWLLNPAAIGRRASTDNSGNSCNMLASVHGSRATHVS